MMRISTQQVFDNGVFNMLRNQYDAYRLQNQLSTGRRVVTPADDPVAAAQALVVEQKKSVNQQFLDNQGNAAGQLKELDVLMNSVSGILMAVKDRWVEAGNGSYSDHELDDISMDVRGKFAEIFGIANNSDATGFYRFAGYKAATRPFVSVNNVVSYRGDSGERLLQVETARFIPVSFSGHEFFEAIPTGNGYFVANPGNSYGLGSTSNTGTGVISNGSMLSSAFDGNTYSIEFTAPGQYDLYVNGTLTSSANPYVAGTSIPLGGAEVSIDGTPNVGDTFEVSPSREESIFATLNKFLSLLASGHASETEFRNGMLRVGASLDQALQHILDNRAVVGARLSELEDLTNLGKDMRVEYETQISDLVDLDYNKYISDLSKNQLQLQASQQAFVRVTNLSLFNYI